MTSWVFFGVVAVAGSVTACGQVGPPIPPEAVGVAPTIERQKRFDAMETKQREAAAAEEAAAPLPDPALQGQDENLPPLRPVGAR